jgi:hypothetical protein
MEIERDGLVSPVQEVSVVEGELVAAIRGLASCGVGSRTIARTVVVACCQPTAINEWAERGDLASPDVL